MRARRRLAVVLGLLLASSVLGLLAGGSSVRAGGPIGNDPFDPQDPVLVDPPPGEERLPPKQASREDDFGRIDQFWACYDFGPYPNITQAVYGVQNIILCGTVNIALPAPDGVEVPDGQEWECFDGPDAIKYTVPFTLPICGFGSGGSFIVEIDEQTLLDALTTSADVKVRISAQDPSIVPEFTPEELRALRIRYAKDQLRRQDLFTAQRVAEEGQENELLWADLRKDMGCAVPPLGAFCAVADLGYGWNSGEIGGRNIATGEPLDPLETTFAVLSILTLGAATTLETAGKYAPKALPLISMGEKIAGNRAMAAISKEQTIARAATANVQPTVDALRRTGGTQAEIDAAYIAWNNALLGASKNIDDALAAYSRSAATVEQTLAATRAEIEGITRAAVTASDAGSFSDVLAASYKVAQGYGLVVLP